MFETVDLKVRTESDGHLRIDLPLDLPPVSEVDVTISPRRSSTFQDEAAWQTHIDSVVGSLPDIERPPQPSLRKVEPL